MVAAKKLGGPYSLPTPYGTTTDKTNYFPQVNKKRLRELLDNVSEDDARELLQAVFNEISKDNRTVRLGKRIETAILQFMVENAS